MPYKDPETNRAYSRAYYRANREKCLEANKARREANLERERERSRSWYERNQEKVRAYYEANREETREKVRAYYQREKERFQAEASKLCECGCGGLAPVATRNRYSRGQRKGEPLRFISGHFRPPPPPSMPGPLNQNWLGDKAGYHGIHRWLTKHHPKTGICSECGRTPQGKSVTHWAFLHHPERHTRNINDYRELCPACHKRLDGSLTGSVPSRGRKGEANRHHKLTDEEVRDIRSDRRTLREIAADHGVSIHSIWLIRKGKSWTHVH